ncbi:MAG: hypothetical protein AAFP26_14415, partial [Planctomycetota bacterium]
FTPEELAEAERNGLAPDPKEAATGARSAEEKSADAMFDEAVAEIYHQQMELRAEDQRLADSGF